MEKQTAARENLGKLAHKSNEVYADESIKEIHGGAFGMGNPNDAFAQYFKGIPANVKHWHGAKKDSWFSHIAVEVPGEATSNEWCEPVSDEKYDKLGE